MIENNCKLKYLLILILASFFPISNTEYPIMKLTQLDQSKKQQAEYQHLVVPWLVFGTTKYCKSHRFIIIRLLNFCGRMASYYIPLRYKFCLPVELVVYNILSIRFSLIWFGLLVCIFFELSLFCISRSNTGLCYLIWVGSE